MPAVKSRNAWAWCILLATVSAVSAGALARLEFFRTLESRTVDHHFRVLSDHPSASTDIVLAQIDDYSIKMLEPEVGRWPWPRGVHAVFLDFMRRAGARLVVFDILFVESDVTNPDDDRELGRATGQAGNVIHAAFLGEQNVGETDMEFLERHSIPGCGGIICFSELDPPIAAVREQARAVGHVAMALDADGPWRRSLPVACFQDRLLPSLPLAAAMVLEGLTVKDIRANPREVRVGSIRAPLDQAGRLPIWFNGPPGSYGQYSYGRIFYSALQLEEGQTPILEPSLFKDKIVIVGLTAAGLEDVFATPYAGGVGIAERSRSGRKVSGKMTGGEIHANVLDSLLHHRYLTQPPGWLISGALALLCLTSLAAVFFLPFWWAAVALVVLPPALLMLSHLLFVWRFQIPLVLMMLGWGFAVVLGFAYQYWIEGAERRRVRRIFSHYVSRDVFNELLNNPTAAALGGKRTAATVLFSDLRGFTTLAENTGPEVLLDQLNEYFSAMVEVVFEHRGTVDKFVGDMIMALFNVPLADPEHADNAVRCAIAMQRRLVSLNGRWRQEGRPEFKSGVGVNTGDMIVGNVGSESIRSYTVIGDNVNLGARLESLSKEHQVEIVISEQTRRLLQGDYRLEEIGQVLVKGKSQPVRIFSVDWRESA